MFSAETLAAESLDPTAAVVAEAGSCAVLKERLERSNNWLDAFTALIWIVALASAVMLVTAIFLAADQNTAGAIATGVGAVLSSSGFGVLLKLRAAQARELDVYLKKFQEQGC